MAGGSEDLELTVVAGIFQAKSAREEELAAVLSRYVILTRSVSGCRNVDLVASVAQPGRFLVIEKWDDADAQRAHVSSDVMVQMATQARELLAARPDLDLYATISAHDLH